MQFAPGQTFARYTIDREIGQGGMGRVYLATDGVLKRKVALKMLLPERTAGEGPQRFAREASLAAMVSHPNVVAVYDYGESEGQPYIAMEYVEGDTLTAHLGDPNIPLTKRLLWLLDVGRALGAAHEKGLVHRDVKPSNVMVTRAGIVKVLDFGLAKQTTPTSGRSFQTLEGRVLGTPRYMAPEQIQGRPVSVQTDQYGLGVLAYELIAGVHPNGASGRIDPPKLLTELDPSLPFRLAVLVARALAKSPEDRFPSMHDLNAELERVISEVAPANMDRETVAPFVTTPGFPALPGVGPAPEAAAAPPGKTLPIPQIVEVIAPTAAPSSTLPVGKGMPVGIERAERPDAGRGDDRAPPGGGRVPAQKTLPSPGVAVAPAPPVAPAAPGAEPGTLRSALDDAGEPLGLAVNAAAKRVVAEPRPPAERAPPPVLFAPAPPAKARSGWSKGMWLTVIGVGICGVVAGAMLTAWAIGGASEPRPAPVGVPSGAPR